MLLVVAALEMVAPRFAPPLLYLDLALVFSLYCGWYSSPLKAALVGSAFGLLQDWMLGVMLGLNGLSKTLLAFCASYLSRWLTAASIPVRFLMLSVFSLLDIFIIFVMLGLLDQPLRERWGADFSIEVLVTGGGGALIFSVYDRFKQSRKDFRHLQ